ncbi:phosphoethanolamine transferase [Providencia vermicola]|uniref:phosphoethanolamine transferase n=1 Tax=Providencia TaxID=586 RepID=UPI0012B63E3C|nr:MULTISPECIES: phosphoethanolamine transferase [Providencia]ELR5144038.1 phosphoethanolamine transferase [Providencia stuartii]MTB41453.1 sulfatase-like hydrolase/transferase [Providencia sp. wls1949]MTC08360.1 sulfatase-like hydrolase/transferase [Providencia sp. wls1948]WER22294.1 phosphoethanolamine transferase [Providencia stuartii]WER26414.1 phosphoethanolamine transferase [Providencia stuartii]
MRLFIILVYFLLISAIPALLSGDISLLSKLAITVTGTLIMLLCAGSYKTLVGKIATVFVAFLWALNLSVSFFFYQKHDIRFSSSIAETFINTNSSETVGMLSYNKYYVLFYLVVFTVYFLSIHKCAKYLNRKVTLASFGLFCVYLAAVPAYYSALFAKQDSYLLLGEQYLSHTPFYNASALIRNLYENRGIRKISSHVVKYQYDKKQPDADIYVLIIGESVRRDHLSLYGYEYDTTPNLNRRKQQMLVFQQAYSPAPVTILSVPVSLSNISFSQMQDKQHYADNIIALANHAGFETYWISNQGKTNKKTSVISSIASMAKHKKWNEFVGYDEEILDYVEHAINTELDDSKKKKLIVLHTYGSHEPSCNRFPEEEYQAFSEQEDDNCYDSSIAYTDKFIDKILQQLEGKSASVMYFSDHALQRLDSDNQIHYHHGVNSPRREAYEIPLFIWYSPNATRPELNEQVLHQPYSTANNYWLMSDWLGIQQKAAKACLSPLRHCYQPQKEINMIDGNRNLLNLKTLPSELSSPQ